MLLTVGTFLFNVLCGLVPCDPKFNSPEIRNNPLNPQDMVKNRNVRQIDPIVHLPNGVVEGHVMKSNEGMEFFAFEGIPYGEAQRWKSPMPKRPWQGVWNAKKPGSDCLQLSIAKMFRVYGSEDCLFANVFTHNLSSKSEASQLRPVIVYIHGGSFIMGAGQEHGPTYIMNEDVVLVTFNYRLGVLGFLSTGDHIMPGNYGLKDQALLLKWVHENIKYFGGNNKNVTLMGNSAGAVSVNLHMISNKTRNYFSTAFSSSGTAFQHWAVQNRETMMYFANRLARQFGCQSNDSYVLINCLEKMDVNMIVAGQLNMFDWFPFPPVLFSPTVEPEHPEAFLTVWPEEAYKAGTVAEKPYIIGTTKDEGKTSILILIPLFRMYPLRVMWDQIGPYFLQYHKSGRVKEISEKVDEFYFKGVSPRRANVDVFGEMVTDRYLALGIIKGAQIHKTFTKSPSYLYYFSFSNGNHNMGNLIGRQASEWGAGHAEDVYYFFNTTIQYDGQKLNDPDREMSSIMIKLLVNFAATGKPTYTSKTGEEFSIWESVEDISNPRVLQLDMKVEMTELPQTLKQRLNFWGTINLPNVTLFSPLEETTEGRIRLKTLER